MLHAGDLTMEMIDDFLNPIGKPIPKLKILLPSATGGRGYVEDAPEDENDDDTYYVPFSQRQRLDKSELNASCGQEFRNYLEGDDDDDAASTVVGSGMSQIESVTTFDMTNSVRGMKMRLANANNNNGNLTGIQEISESMVSLNVKSHNEEDLHVYRTYDFHETHVYDKRLKITEHSEQIMGLIETHSVCIIQGGTGCGKTTQVPQYILDHHAKQDKYCNVIITQPRRIAAISVASRVCNERGWTLGTICGYQIGLDRKYISQDTRISYVTTGVLLQKLILAEDTHRYTHIIVDEVHERDLDVDFTLLILKILMKQNANIKVILMSATIDCARFSRYFNTQLKTLRDAPVFPIEGQTYSVQEHYMEDLYAKGFNRGLPMPDYKPDAPELLDEALNMVIELLKHFDEEEKQKIRETANSSLRIISNLPELRGSVLIFVPGMRQIIQLEQLIYQKFPNSGMNVLPLHSDIVIEQQKRVFEPQQATKRKIIISTSIAESSITVPDIKYVIDFCLTKELWCDPHTNYSHLRLEWASQSSLNQRKGRAGRVSNGVCYRLITRKFYGELDEHTVPQMLRQPLSKLVLNVKRLKLKNKDPKCILQAAMQPPNLEDIDRTVLLLKEVGALTLHPNATDGELTYVGSVMASLPVDVRLTKLILLGHTFGKLRDCVIIAAALSTKTFFTRYMNSNLEAYQAKWHWAYGSFCDCISILNAYNTWEEYQEKGKFPRKQDMEAWARSNMIDLYRIREVRELKNEIEKRLKDFKIECNRFVNEERRQLEGRRYRHDDDDEDDYDIDDENDVERHHLILKIIISGAFYPNYYTSTVNDEYEAYKMVSGKDIRETVMLKGFPMGQGMLYHDKLMDMFKRWSKLLNIHYEDSKAYLQFKSDYEEVKTNVSFGVYQSVQMRLLRIPLEIPRLTDTIARRLMENFNKVRESERNSSLTIKNVKEHIVYKYSTNYVSDDDEDDDEEVKGSKVNLSSSRAFRSSTAMTPTNNRLAEYLSNPEYLLNKCYEFGISITEQIECGHFWCQIAGSPYVETLGAIQTKLNSGYKLVCLSNSTNLYVGMLVVAPFCDEAGETFMFRAKIIHIDQDYQTVDLVYVDYGNKQSKRFHQLYLMTEDLQKYPFQAIQCKLTNLKVNKLKCPTGVWSNAANDCFYRILRGRALKASVFSIVDNVVRIQLLDKDTNENIHDAMINSGYAVACDESQMSQLQHMELYSVSYPQASPLKSNFLSYEEDENKNLVPLSSAAKTKKKNEHVRDLNDSLVSLDMLKDDQINIMGRNGVNRDDPRNYSGTLRLAGPYSPLEVTYHPVINIGRNKLVRVATTSINHVTIDDDPQNEFERMMVAAEVTLNHSGNGVILRGTTLLPKIRGLANMLCLLFTPTCEVRLSTDKKSFTGALCGLGCDRKTKIPLYVDNDIECTFDVKMGFEEFKMINTVRMAMNMIIGNEENARDWTAEPRLLRKLQQKACNRLLELIQRERSPVEPVFFNKHGRWNQLKSSEIIPLINEEIKFENSLYTSHNVAVLQDNLE